jgi:hypothetical protein
VINYDDPEDFGPEDALDRAEYIEEMSIGGEPFDRSNPSGDARMASRRRRPRTPGS